eukprot:SAG31_NODE_3598_length_4085_cov_4.935273_6_plen_44_part_00
MVTTSANDREPSLTKDISSSRNFAAPGAEAAAPVIDALSMSSA